MKCRLYFRAFEFEDLDFLNQIRNDEEAFLHTGGNKYYISKEYDKKWLEDKIFNNQHQIYLAICLYEKDEIIGYLGISDIDYRNSKAKWAGINISKKFAKKGYATEAASLLLKFVFEELGLNRFYGYWLDSNIPSVKMAEKVGFTKEGMIRDFVFKINGYHSAYIMSILRKEYCDIYCKKQNE